MPVPSDNPIQQPPQPPQTFDHWWIERITMTGAPGQKTRVEVTFVRVTADNRPYLDSHGRPDRRMVIVPDFASVPNAQALMTQGIVLCGQYAKSQGIID